MNAKFIGPMVVVRDIPTSLQFYETLLEQTVTLDAGACQCFASGLSLQERESMTTLFNLPREKVLLPGVNTMLYFEAEDFDAFTTRLEGYPDLQYVHGVVTHSWGQRSISFYDPDGHAIDVSETMAAVGRRLQAQGMTREQIAEATEHPMALVNQWLDE